MLIVRQNYQVHRPLGPKVLPADLQPKLLPAGTRVKGEFDRSDRQLLILGELGSGKTTLLLDLAQDLLQIAQMDNRQPIPVLVDLPSWNPKQSIQDWLLGKLREDYGLRSDQAIDLLRQHQLLPLLDHLDEVANQHQRACAIAINDWMTGDLELRPCGLVVCCRREEYERNVRLKLRLYGAVYLQSLTWRPESIILPPEPLSMPSDRPVTHFPTASSTGTRRESRSVFYPVLRRWSRKLRSIFHAIPRRLRQLCLLLFVIGMILLIWRMFNPPVRISAGEEVLITDGASIQKKLGVQAMKKGDFNEAINQFGQSLNQIPNDPESLIYLNNAKASNDSLTIAVSVPISTNPNVAQEILRGVAHSQNAVNKGGGINGKLLRVRIADDANNPEYATKVATVLAKESKIIAVVGHNATDTSIAAAAIYQKEGLVMISPTSGGERLSNFGDGIFRTIPPVSSMASLLAKHVVEIEGNTKISTCADPDASDSRAFYDAFRTVLRDLKDSKGNPGELVEIKCSLTIDFDPNEVLRQAQENHVQGILVVPFIDHLERAIKLVQQNNGLALYSSPTMNTSQVLKDGKAKVEGLILPVIWERTQPTSLSFAGTAKRLWRADVNWRTAMAYDATQAIVKGLAQSQTREGLKAILRDKNFSANGANGSIQFLPSGDRKMDDPKTASTTPTLVKVEKAVNSSTDDEFNYEFKRVLLMGTESNNQESAQPTSP
jgi:branched-chain amino acid transport system substrate-binding protein